MNRCNLWRLYLFDIKKGFKENKLKIAVACFIFLFLANITIKNCLIQQSGSGYLSYWITILGGMPEYIKTETSIFQLPVSWFLFYAYLFFLIGFYPVSDLYSGGAKTLILAGNRNKWIISKLFWTVTMIIIYFGLFAICLFVNAILFGNTNDGLSYVADYYGISSEINLPQVIIVFLVAPVIVAIAMSFIQFVISIIVNALSGYIIVISILSVSAYWMKGFLLGNYLMLIRYDLISGEGMKVLNGIVLSMGIIILMVASSCLLFAKKDIYKTSEKD